MAVAIARFLVSPPVRPFVGFLYRSPVWPIAGFVLEALSPHPIAGIPIAGTPYRRAVYRRALLNAPSPGLKSAMIPAISGDVLLFARVLGALRRAAADLDPPFLPRVVLYSFKKKPLQEPKFLSDGDTLPRPQVGR